MQVLGQGNAAGLPPKDYSGDATPNSVEKTWEGGIFGRKKGRRFLVAWGESRARRTIRGNRAGGKQKSLTALLRQVGKKDPS